MLSTISEMDPVLIAAAVFFIVRVVHRKRGKKAAKPSKKENGAAG